MQNAVISYTIGVKRRFLPIWKKYTVTAHDSDIVGNDVRLHLQLTDGTQLVVPGISRRVLKVYPDYRNAQVTLNKLRGSSPTPEQAPVVDAMTEFDALLQQRRATGG